jgi:hypothetical protein
MASPGRSVVPMALGNRMTAVPGHTDSAAMHVHMDLAAVGRHMDSAAVLEHRDSAAVGSRMALASVGKVRAEQHSICLRACHVVFLGNLSVPVHEHIGPPGSREGSQAMDSICLRSCLA